MRKSALVGIGVILFVALVVGMFAINQVYYYLQNKRQTELLNLSQITSSVVVPGQIEHMSGTEEDIKTQDYALLRDQFQKIGDHLKDFGVYQIYLMKKVDEKIVFLVDSLPSGHEWHTDPGVVYQEPPDELLKAFNSGDILTTDKYTDEFGTFFSTFIPILKKGQSQLVGMFGADIDYNAFEEYVSGQVHGVILADVLLTLLLVTGYVFWLHLRVGKVTAMKHASELEQKVKERTNELDTVNKRLEEIVVERTSQLQNKLKDIEKMNALMVNRELKMVELKNELSALKNKAK